MANMGLKISELKGVVMDNDPKHTANVNKAWYKEVGLDVLTLEHPPYSPDLNTIEDLWSIIT